MDALRLVDKSTGRTITLQEPTGLTNNLSFTFPSTAGTQGQTLSIGSVSGNSVNFGWVTAAKSFASLAARMTANQTTNNGVATAAAAKLSASVSANRIYRIQGVIRGQRGNAGTGDNIIIRADAPANTTNLQLGVRCFNCPAATTGVPTLQTGTTTVSTTVDPAGIAGTTSFGPYGYQIDGFVSLGNTSGTIDVYFVESGGTNNTTISQDSFIVLTELN
jgi:hypothetical protein